MFILVSSTQFSAGDDLDSGVAYGRHGTVSSREANALRDLSLLNTRDAIAQLDVGLQELDAAAASTEAQVRLAYVRAMAIYAESPASSSNIQDAVRGFEAVLRLQPDGPYAPRAEVKLARIAEVIDFLGDQPKLEAARRRYRVVMEKWPDSASAQESALWYAGTYVQDVADESAIRQGVQFLESWIDAHPDSVYRATHLEWLGAVYLHSLREPEPAVAAFRAALEVGLDDSTAEAGRFWTVASYSELALDDPATAAHYYRRIILEAPRSGRTFEAQMALNRLAERHPELEIVVPDLAHPFHQSSGESPRNVHKEEEAP